MESDHGGAEDGRWAFPFNTLAEGVAIAPPNEIMTIRAGSTPMPAAINKAVTLEAWDGVVTIGQ